MNVSQSALAYLFLYAFLLGAGLGAIYDGLRITRVFLGVHYSRRMAKRLRAIQLPLLPPRKTRRESKALGTVMFFEDLLFCLLTGVALVLLFYQVNNGKFRFSAIVCVGGGFLLYRATVGRLVILLSEGIAFVIGTAARYLWFFTLLPFQVAGRWTKKQACAAVERTVRKSHKHKRVRYTAAQRARMSFDACGMLSQEALAGNKLKKGKRYDTRSKKTVQSQSAGADPFGSVGGGIHRDICQ